MKWKLDRIISVGTLVASLVAIVLVLKKPQPVAPAQSPAAVAANVQSLEHKLEQLEQPKEPGQAPAQVHFSSEEITAALAQAVAALPANMPASAALIPGTGSVSAAQAPASPSLPTTVPSSPDVAIGEGEPEVKDYKVNFDGDVARGQFVTQIGGKDVYVTLAGHLGSKDGYATFDPTEFKVGDLNVPVSLVSGALEKKLTEQRDRLKLPDDVGSIRVENGQLVATQK
jgi:hypothetical protein